MALTFLGKRQEGNIDNVDAIGETGMDVTVDEG